MLKFALIGSGGYVAPRHMKAIHDTGNQLVASLDVHDSVGVIDRYFPDSYFFTEFERFDRFVEKKAGTDQKIDYLVVCSPNHLHDAHVRYGLKAGMDVICEKPIVLNPWNITSLQRIQEETNHSAFSILQLRLHPSVQKLKEQVDIAPKEQQYDITLTYITPRGHWYYTSWKGDEEKSGGIATNIGVHFFDMLIWIFGKIVSHTVQLREHDRAGGIITFKNAKVKWFLSINAETLPDQKAGKPKALRQLFINDMQVDFSHGFEELHTESYKKVLNDEGFTLEDVEPSISLVSEIRKKTIEKDIHNQHEYVSLPLSKHPFLN